MIGKSIADVTFAPLLPEPRAGDGPASVLSAAVASPPSAGRGPSRGRPIALAGAPRAKIAKCAGMLVAQLERGLRRVVDVVVRESPERHAWHVPGPIGQNRTPPDARCCVRGLLVLDEPQQNGRRSRTRFWART